MKPARATSWLWSHFISEKRSSWSATTNRSALLRSARTWASFRTSSSNTCPVEHFRCVPEIIQFSNMISYDWRIKPLRDASRVQLHPHTVAYRVSGSSRDGKVNRQEALGVASLLAAAIEQPEY